MALGKTESREKWRMRKVMKESERRNERVREKRKLTQGTAR